MTGQLVGTLGVDAESPDRKAAVRAAVSASIVGREREVDLVLAAVAAGRDLILEGPPGTSKTTLLRAITAEWGIPLLFVEGNADLSPATLLGHHSPSRVLRSDYGADTFVDGPLLSAMRTGGFLYIEEFNRAPDDTLNVLLTAMADREIMVPRVGIVRAQPSFRTIASMNPFDNVGTTRLSTSLLDRMCRLAMGYQDRAAELDIVRRRTVDDGRLPADLIEQIRADAVDLTRATRMHDAVRQGSSVRGAIDLTLVALQLAALRAVTSDGEGRPQSEAAQSPRHRYAETVWDAMTLALSARVHLFESLDAGPETVLRQLWTDHFLLRPALAAPG